MLPFASSSRSHVGGRDFESAQTECAYVLPDTLHYQNDRQGKAVDSRQHTMDRIASQFQVVGLPGCLEKRSWRSALAFIICCSLPVRILLHHHLIIVYHADIESYQSTRRTQRTN
jgi:hypothetical protein